MAIDMLLQKAEKFEIEMYKKPKDAQSLARTHVAFTGSPQKHPYDGKKVILMIDPYSTSLSYYEFKKSDISYVEELYSLVNPDGECYTMARVWVKKMSVGVRATPFIVADIRS